MCLPGAMVMDYRIFFETPEFATDRWPPVTPRSICPCFFRHGWTRMALRAARMKRRLGGSFGAIAGAAFRSSSANRTVRSGGRNFGGEGASAKPEEKGITAKDAKSGAKNKGEGFLKNRKTHSPAFVLRALRALRVLRGESCFLASPASPPHPCGARRHPRSSVFSHTQRIRCCIHPVISGRRPKTRRSMSESSIYTAGKSR